MKLLFTSCLALLNLVPCTAANPRDSFEADLAKIGELEAELESLQDEKDSIDIARCDKVEQTCSSCSGNGVVRLQTYLQPYSAKFQRIVEGVNPPYMVKTLPDYGYDPNDHNTYARWDCNGSHERFGKLPGFNMVVADYDAGSSKVCWEMYSCPMYMLPSGLPAP